jgi:hypothetical protein
MPVLWRNPKFVDRLRAMRGPGETYSDVILRLADAIRLGCSLMPAFSAVSVSDVRLTCAATHKLFGSLRPGPTRLCWRPSPIVGCIGGGPTVRCGSCGLPTRQRDAPPTQGIPPPSRGGRRAPERPFRWWSANRSRSARLSHAPMRKWRRRIARLKIRADADLLPHCRRQLHDERAIGLR